MRSVGLAASDPESRSPWTRHLEGSLHERALEVVVEITEALKRAEPIGEIPGVPTSEDDSRARRASISCGWAGLAVFHGYRALSSHGADRNDAAELAARFIDRATIVLGQTKMSPGLYSGFSGVAWAVDHLESRCLQPAPEDSCEEIDRELERYLSVSPWHHSFDLIGGLVGIGVYALERMPRAGARRCLEQIVARLAELAQERPGGLTWHTGPGQSGPILDEQCPDGLYNLGLAHGVPGVIAFLGAVYGAGVARSEAGRLLSGAVSWLLKQSLPAGSPSRFPFFVAPGAAPGSRIAWCYGDPGVAAALLSAAEAADEPHWRGEAMSTAVRAARRPPRDSGVVDAGLCHGAAGLAHIFNRLFQATGEEELARASRDWYERILQLREPGKGVAGYRVQVRDGDTVTRQDTPDLLYGTAGIGLALLAATAEVEPAWDRIFLLSFPPRRR